MHKFWKYVMYFSYISGAGLLLFGLYIMFNPSSFKDKDLFLVVSNGLNFIILYFIFEYHSSKVKRGNINSLYFSLACSLIMTILSLYI